MIPLIASHRMKRKLMTAIIDPMDSVEFMYECVYNIHNCLEIIEFNVVYSVNSALSDNLWWNCELLTVIFEIFCHHYFDWSCCTLEQTNIFIVYCTWTCVFIFVWILACFFSYRCEQVYVALSTHSGHCTPGAKITVWLAMTIKRREKSHEQVQVLCQ